MRRDVLIESGYRCGMPHCRETQIDVHHIVDYAKVKEHRFDNLIALCPNCHRRVTNGEVDQKAIKQIKANLSVLSHRYSEVERRYLQLMAEGTAQAGAYWRTAGGLDLLMMGLMHDRLVEQQIGGASIGSVPGVPPMPAVVLYVLTAKGQEFIQNWTDAAPLD